jgi:hypothetical protein
MAVPCNRCNMLLTTQEYASTGACVCSFCLSPNTVRLFPALYQTRPAPTVAEVAADNEATCFDHPQKRAADSCSQCGRFVCQLCAVPFRGATWCPSCVSGGPKAKPVAALEPSRMLYDSMALTLALGPLLMWPFTVLTAPAALFVIVKFWKRPLGVVRRWRWRFAAAALIAGSQLVGWVWLTFYLIAEAKLRK